MALSRRRGTNNVRYRAWARTDETTDICARHQHCRAGAEPALTADLGRQADARQIDREHKIVIAVGEQLSGASDGHAGCLRRNRAEAVERVQRRRQFYGTALERFQVEPDDRTTERFAKIRQALALRQRVGRKLHSLLGAGRIHEIRSSQ